VTEQSSARSWPALPVDDWAATRDTLQLHTLATTRFSGRTAPDHPGEALNCGPHVMLETYSHEVSSCGYWPGPPGEEGVFHSYAYPEPAGSRDITGLPEGARWDDGLGEFVLPLERGPGSSEGSGG